jgi:hypothetical protein
VRQARAEEIPLVIDEDLRLVFEATKSGRVYDPVPVALKIVAMRSRFGVGVGSGRVSWPTQTAYAASSGMHANVRQLLGALRRAAPRRSATASPDFLQQDQAQLACLHLLVVVHQFEVAFDRSTVRPLHRQTCASLQTVAFDAGKIMAASIQPSCDDSSAAIIVPAAIASPCSHWP